MFICINMEQDNYPNEPIYISNVDRLMEIKRDDVVLRCSVDNLPEAVAKFKNVNKNINYYLAMNDFTIMDNYKNIFDVFKKIQKYQKVILGLELTLKEKLKNSDFRKLIEFLNNIYHKFDLKLKIDNIAILNYGQLQELNNIDNLNINFELEQLYHGIAMKHPSIIPEKYTIDDMLVMKREINTVVSEIPREEDIYKVYFVYKYLGKKLNYSHSVVGLGADERRIFDRSGIYNALFYNCGVCVHFANLMRNILISIGIECLVVYSDDHAWNVVKINDLWYHLDLTYDLDNIKENSALKYFMKSEKVMTNVSHHQMFGTYAKESEKACKSLAKRLYLK